MSWTEATTTEQLEEEKKLLFRAPDGKQIALFWVEGEVYAVDNRCPHEGYPLREGTVDDGSCVLTCQWHNWKFNLKDGSSLYGGDAVRTYPTRIEGEEIWLDLSDPSPEQRQAKILEGLRDGFERRNYGQISREIARLLHHGLDPLEGLRQVLAWSHDHLEYGTSHAYAVTADWLELYHREGATAQDKIAALTESIDHIALDALRHPEYSFPTPEQALPFDGPALLDAIEAEDQQKALQIAAGGLREGLTWAQWQPWLSRAALAHYNDFGHTAIYTYKSKQAVEYLGDGVMPYLLLPLIRSMCYTTREDLLPEFRPYAPALQECPEFTGEDAAAIDPSGLEQLSVKRALGWVIERAEDHHPKALYAALFAASSMQLLRYDMSFQFDTDNDVKDNAGWLHLTHALTFANAARAFCHDDPELWRPTLLQMACFVGRNHKYIDPHYDPSPWLVEDVEGFFDAMLPQATDHGLFSPIYSSHRLKTLCAVWEEQPHLSPEAQRLSLAAVHRYLHEPLKEKHVHRTAQQSLALVSKET